MVAIWRRKLGENEAKALLKIDKMLNPGKIVEQKSNRKHSGGGCGQISNVKKNPMN